MHKPIRKGGFHVNTGFDWSQFERFFGGKLPSMPSAGGDMSKWVEDYVQSVLKQSFSGASNETAPHHSELKPDITELDRNIIVKMSIPRGMLPQQLQVKAGLNQLRISGFPNNQVKTILLPGVINTRRCRAQTRDGTLIIKAPKLDRNDDFVNVSINHQ